VPLIDISDIEAASQRIVGHVVRTPTVASPGLSALLGVPVSFKLELLQRTGSFKARGATAKLLELSETDRKAGGGCGERRQPCDRRRGHG
jgi:threonine dehydratase